MAQIGAEAAAAAAEAEAAVTDKIWYFIPPGKSRKELGPFCVRDLYDFLSRWAVQVVMLNCHMLC
jgi:hypothetical protein